MHIPVIRIITEKRYDPLMGISAERPAFEETPNNATNTLITKILLGTLGCVPAYDRYYVQAVRHYGISSGIFNKESVRNVAKYYIDNKAAFEEVRLAQFFFLLPECQEYLLRKKIVREKIVDNINENRYNKCSEKWEIEGI